VEVTFVGSGDAFGSGGRFQTCIRLRAAGLTVLVDCGATSLTAMKAQQVDPGEVDAVVLSHLHGDHFGGLPFLILDGQFTRRTTPLRVFGPAGTAARLRAALETSFPGSAAARRRFEVVLTELDGSGDPARAGPLTVRAWEVDHPSGAPALAVRADLDGQSFGYSGDTAWTPALIRAAARTDLFACEAYTYQHPVPHHLDYTTIRQHRADLDTARLVLTHLGPTALANLDKFDDPVATDGLVLHT
jgi:ribonuclease BN (tRNA processing enzyme)